MKSVQADCPNSTKLMRGSREGGGGGFWTPWKIQTSLNLHSKTSKIGLRPPPPPETLENIDVSQTPPPPRKIFLDSRILSVFLYNENNDTCITPCIYF